MKTVTIRDLRTRPKQVRDALRREREAVLTANGQPVAVLIPVDAGSIEETLETFPAQSPQADQAVLRSGAHAAPFLSTQTPSSWSAGGMRTRTTSS